MSVQALPETARSYITLAGAGRRRRGSDIRPRQPPAKAGLGVLPGLAGQLRSKLAPIKAGADGAPSLTAAKLRLPPLLWQPPEVWRLPLSGSCNFSLVDLIEHQFTLRRSSRVRPAEYESPRLSQHVPSLARTRRASANVSRSVST